jgi:hypothetical protein
MNLRITRSLRHAAVSAFLFVFSALIVQMPATAAPPKPPLDTPTLTFVSATQTSITIQVTAGATGAPYGFSIQWMTQADYLANGFSSDPPLGCAASFAGEAAGSRYPLPPNGSVTVTAGNFLQDNGFSTSCSGPLVCGTAYVFRVFAHGGRLWADSPKPWPLYVFSTAPCSTGCTLTQGYWKTHGPIPVGNNLDTWLLVSIPLGNTVYTDAQALSILNTPPKGNGLISLAHQLIAAKLSVANGADPSAIAAAIAAADAMIGNLVIPPVGNGFLDPTVTQALNDELDAWLNANECNSTDS